jgi:predicted NAD/FAD-binding protein
MPSKCAPKRIAIVGSGGSALAAIYALGKTNHKITLFEAGDRIGGHLNAAKFTNPRNEESCMVDAAFQIINDTTYRMFTFTFTLIYSHSVH